MWAADPELGVNAIQGVKYLAEKRLPKRRGVEGKTWRKGVKATGTGRLGEQDPRKHRRVCQIPVREDREK